jgi:N-acetylmuramoyl-L-alanine amidase
LKEYDNVVGDILLDKAQKETLTNSSKFAELLIENLTGKTPMLNRSHRKEDLRVLLAADVPAVLLEMAFISNAKDEANLNSPVWRNRAMTAVADSIDRYFEEQTPQRHAAARAGGSQ